MIAKTAELDSGKWKIPGTDADKTDAERQERTKKLVPLLLDTFDENELRELCMDFDLSYEDIPGDTRRQKVMQLVHYFYRRHTLDVLINWLSGQRPNVKWPGQEGDL